MLPNRVKLFQVVHSCISRRDVLKLEQPAMPNVIAVAFLERVSSRIQTDLAL
jgi:hypothetical protein